MVISLVLPCFNPPHGWEQNVHSSYLTFCENVKEHVELVVVVDGGRANEINNALAFLEQNIGSLRVIRYEENRGKGYALRQGVGIAAGDTILYTDIDFPYTMDSVMAVYGVLHKGECDVAVGVKNEQYYMHVPFLRKVISRVLRFLIKLFLSTPITDTQCGLKGFKRDVAHLFLQTTIDRYLFDLEFVRNCFISKKFRVKAIPVALKENVRFRKMDYRILLPEMLNFVKLLFK